MSFGPPPSVYTQSALTAETRQKKRRTKRLFGGLVAVALVAALGVGGALLLAPDEDGERTAAEDATPTAKQGRLDVRETVERRPASDRGAMAVRFSVDDMSPGERYEMPGLWATDKILAKGINRTLVGIGIGTDAAPGEEAWKLPLDGPICGKTRHVTGENRTAVLFRESQSEDAHCNRVAFVDLDDGTKVWQAEIPVSGQSDDAPANAAVQRDPGVTLISGTVAVTWGGGTDAYSMDTGKRRWRVEGEDAGACGSDGAGGGPALLVRYSCPDPDAPLGSSEALTYKIRALDPETGATRWTYEPAKGVRDVRIVSTDPVALATATGDVGITEILSLDGDGKRRATVRLENGAYVAECADEVDHVAADDCPTIVAGAGQVFLTSKEQGDLVNNANWVVGFDLATGRTVKKFESGRNSLLRPLRMSGDRLLALRESSDHITPMGLVALDPKTGAETPYLYFDLPSEAWNLTSVTLADAVVQNGRIFFGAKAADGPSEEDGKAWTWLALGIESDVPRKK